MNLPYYKMILIMHVVYIKVCLCLGCNGNMHISPKQGLGCIAALSSLLKDLIITAELAEFISRLKQYNPKNF